MYKRTKPFRDEPKGLCIKEMRQRPTLPLVAVPSALRSLTAVFGMGTGGASSLGHLIKRGTKNMVAFNAVMESVVWVGRARAAVAPV
jgi:hypothetical protein